MEELKGIYRSTSIVIWPQQVYFDIFVLKYLPWQWLSYANFTST